MDFIVVPLIRDFMNIQIQNRKKILKIKVTTTHTLQSYIDKLEFV